MPTRRGTLAMAAENLEPVRRELYRVSEFRASRNRVRAAELLQSEEL